MHFQKIPKPLERFAPNRNPPPLKREKAKIPAFIKILSSCREGQGGGFYGTIKYGCPFLTV